ncbi:hypothetical protein Q31b_10650 [Novipirellula aureliae]|uniref:Uncharacterized protein n=1 Tax=Novipirellula aureliae TaxID=2527966 RepID=A0A5C6EF85_9BACT|nr:hypothetical protein Q31b_10650 [Novipirellula aureliae]
MEGCLIFWLRNVTATGLALRQKITFRVAFFVAVASSGSTGSGSYSHVNTAP